ncbi:uncharacterized protein LOC142350394 [Convolutriloba macropyga]|uniref:uncharacterized protein LOC142350394 n=1 Tax=Convolutriloba macropyga TaxID=536237 RepID=UPI003F52768A
MNQKTISESKSHREFSVPQSKFKVSKKGVEGLKILEEALRRTNKTEVKARNQMLWISKTLRQINAKEVEKRRDLQSVPLIYNGINLLSFTGARDDYEGYGRFLARSLFTKEERVKFCWFSQRTTREGRLAAPEEEENYFREAVRRFCGDSLYALRRVKDAANVLGLREKNERLEN